MYVFSVWPLLLHMLTSAHQVLKGQAQFPRVSFKFSQPSAGQPLVDPTLPAADHNKRPALPEVINKKIWLFYFTLILVNV